MKILNCITAEFHHSIFSKPIKISKSPSNRYGSPDGPDGQGAVSIDSDADLNLCPSGAGLGRRQQSLERLKKMEDIIVSSTDQFNSTITETKKLYQQLEKAMGPDDKTPYDKERILKRRKQR